MPDELQTECYFLSSDILEICQGNPDIIITIKVTNASTGQPTWEIVADGWREAGIRAGDPKKSCPSPCHTIR